METVQHAKKQMKEIKEVITSEGFIKSVKSDIAGKEYRPEIVLVLHYTNDGEVLILLVKSARSGVWCLMQEGVKEGEKPRDAVLRCLLEEILHINISQDEPILEKMKDWAEDKYFVTPLSYRIFHVAEAKTPGRSRGIFNKGKKYYFVSVLLRKEIDIVSLSDNLCPEEISDIELVNIAETHCIMICTGVAIRKRHIVVEALRKLTSVQSSNAQVGIIPPTHSTDIETTEKTICTKMITLEYGVSDHALRAPGLSLDGEGRQVHVPLVGDIKDIGKYYNVEKYKSVNPELAKDNSTVIIEEGFPIEGSQVRFYWIKDRAEWIAVVRTNCLEDYGEDDSYSGPYRIDDFCARKILQAYGVAASMFLSLDDVRKTSPAQLNSLRTR